MVSFDWFFLKVLILCFSLQMTKLITSPQNSFVKSLIQLRDKSRNRRQSGQFIIEGKRELTIALTHNYQLEQLLLCTDVLSQQELDHWSSSPTKELIHINREVYAKLALRDSTEGVLAVASAKSHDLKALSLTSAAPLLLVAEAPEKPGNIGALLRTADAANLDGVIIANPKTDLYNPNIIRSSVGCLFSNQVATGTTEEVLAYLKANNIRSFAACLEDALPYHEQDYSSASAIVVGTEADGLSEQWLNEADARIKIPMQGSIDSMNVSVAAGILIFEAKRQRNFSN